MPEKCSFCGKPAEEVQQLITAPKAAICDNCVFGCLEVLVYGDEEITIDLAESDDDAESNTGC